MSYLDKLLALAELVGNMRGAQLEATVRHDAWCPLLSGKGPCSCSPELELIGRDGDGNPVRYRMREDGNLEAS